MFNRKLKSRISELEKALSDEKKRSSSLLNENISLLKENNYLRFKILYPSKYKKGDKVGRYIVHEVNYGGNVNSILPALEDIIIISTEFIKKWLSNKKLTLNDKVEILSKVRNQWVYEVEDTILKTNCSKIEAELIVEESNYRNSNKSLNTNKNAKKRK